MNEGATKCPVCGVGPDKWEEIVEGAQKDFKLNTKISEKWAGSEESYTSLKANFEGDMSTEVEMYLGYVKSFA